MVWEAVLGVMNAKDLEQAVDWQNSVPYGLTAGIQSLNEKECEYWIENVEAGNLYVNRTTTGAVVDRHPFGGWKKVVLAQLQKQVETIMFQCFVNING